MQGVKRLANYQHYGDSISHFQKKHSISTCLKQSEPWNLILGILEWSVIHYSAIKVDAPIMLDENPRGELIMNVTFLLVQNPTKSD